MHIRWLILFYSALCGLNFKLAYLVKPPFPLSSQFWYNILENSLRISRCALHFLRIATLIRGKPIVVWGRVRAISHVRTISLTRMHRQIFIRMNIELCRFHPNSNVLKNERICCTFTSMILALASLAHFSSTLFIPLSPQSHSVYFSSSLPFRLLLDIASIYRHSFVQLGLWWTAHQIS